MDGELKINPKSVSLSFNNKKYIVKYDKVLSLSDADMQIVTVDPIMKGKTGAYKFSIKIASNTINIFDLNREYCIVFFSDDKVLNSTVIVSLLKKNDTKYVTLKNYTIVDSGLKLAKPKTCGVEVGPASVFITLGKEVMTVPLSGKTSKN